MPNVQNHWKLGLFVVAGLAMALAVVAVLGARSMQRDVGLYVSYFDESVQGLEVGSPIKFRGVTIGTVNKIRVASDHRHVEVESALGVEELTRLGLNIAEKRPRFGAPRKLVMTVDLRLQLESAGLTGVKFLQLDFFDVTRYPLPVLPFPVPKNYIPTAPSMMKSLEASIILIANRVPEITDHIASMASEIHVIVGEVSARNIPERIATTFDKMDGLLDTTQQTIEKVNVKGLSENANLTLDSVNGAATRLDDLIVSLNQKEGLLSSFKRASDQAGDTLNSFKRASDKAGDTLSSAKGIGSQLVDTLESVQSAARSMRKLTEALEQDPDMLLKGRSPERKR